MKALHLVIVICVCTFLSHQAIAQNKPGGPTNRETSAQGGRPEYRVHDELEDYRQTPRFGSAEAPILPEGVGICLIGDKYGYIDNAGDADKCDAVMWISTVKWADNQRKLIDETILAGDVTESDGATICRSCSGTCQIVSLPIKDSTYEDVEVDGGQSPGACLKTIREICESGDYLNFVSARCGN